MKLRYKLNLVAVGYCGMGALASAMAGNLGVALLCIALAYFNWACALNSESKEEVH